MSIFKTIAVLLFLSATNILIIFLTVFSTKPVEARKKDSQEYLLQKNAVVVRELINLSLRPLSDINRQPQIPKTPPELPDHTTMIRGSVIGVSDSSDSTTAFTIAAVPAYRQINPTRMYNRNGYNHYAHFREINFSDSNSILNKDSRKE